jgi:myosin heavy subunit
LAYSELAFQGINQSILITGESGSGKTEAAKLLMHHLACIQQGPSRRPVFSPVAQQPQRKQQQQYFCETVQRILDANPLLESFGNAATERNDNSSRFGKYTQLQFDRGGTARKLDVKTNVRLIGSQSSIYLLEASRICHHSSNERTYHIFYQILAADVERKRHIWTYLENKRPQDFRYVGVDARPDIDDATDFETVYAALQRIGLTEGQILELLRAVCIVMLLGNVVFFDDATSMSDRASVKSQDEFEELSRMMGISTTALYDAFTQRTMETRDEIFKVPLRAELAKQSCDALAKEIYINAFSWLVNAINTKTAVRDPNRDVGTIGLLDIFGFESLKENIFGQLCINFTNEKLHNKAMRDIFDLTIEEYKSEGIPLAQVGYDDNEVVLAFFEGRTGVIAMLNEEAFRPKGNDSAFVAKLLELHKENRLLMGPTRPGRLEFGIKHFAGTVTYTARNFVESNQDTLPADLKKCAQSSQNPVISSSMARAANKDDAAAGCTCPSPKAVRVTGREIPTDSGADDSFSETLKKSLEKEFGTSKHMDLAKSPKRESQFSTKSKFSPKKLHSFDGIAQSPLRNESSDNAKTKAMTRTSSGELMGKSVLVKYQEQVADLMDALNRTHSRYVRCIKPNASRTPRSMDNKYTIDQIRCSGIVATVQLTAAIFSKTLSNHLLRLRYHEMWDKSTYPSKATKIDRPDRQCQLDCEAILKCVLRDLIDNHGGKTEQLFAVGKTKCYFRKGILECLESRRIIELDAVAATIQKRVRGIQTRKVAARFMWAIPIIQQWFRKVSKYKRYNQRAQRRKFLEARGVFDKHRKKPTSTTKMPLRPVAAGVGK